MFFIINIISTIIILILSYYLLYFLYITYCCSFGKIKEIEKRSYNAKFEQNLNVIIYSNNDEESLVNLVECLQKQEYSKDKYTLNVILDNCTDNSAKKLEIIGGARLWRINNNGDTKGKNIAISWLLERVLKQENTNAFVFLNAKYVVKQDFLTKINNELCEYPVVTGKIITPVRFSGIKSSIRVYRNKIIYKLLKRGRAWAGLNNLINTDVCAIRQEVLEKVQFTPTENKKAEAEYSIKLSNNDISAFYSSHVVAFKQHQESFTDYIKNISTEVNSNINAFVDNFKILSTNELSFKQKEFICSLIYPSETILILLFATLLYCASTPSYLLEQKIHLFFINCYSLALLFAFMVVRLSLKDGLHGLIWTVISPFAMIFAYIKNYNTKLQVKTIKEDVKPQKDKEDKAVSVTLTDGHKEFPCKLDIVQKDGLHKIIFMFNNKKMSSSSHLRCNDALQEIIDKLMGYGFALKVCQNCGYFRSESNGRTNCDQGKCLFGLVNEISDTAERTYIWKSCKKIIPTHAREFVNQKLVDKD